MTRDDVSAAIRSLPNGAHAPLALEQRVVEMLEARGDFFTFTGGVASIALHSAEDALSRHDLGVVTRRVLEEILAEAGIPKELLDSIVQTYVAEGKLTMSEDGGRYFISLR